MTQDPKVSQYGTSEGDPMGREGSVEVERRPSSHEMDGGLLDSGDSDRFSGRWDTIQASFVDRPREAVQEAQQLLDEVFTSMSEAFSRRRSKLEEQWQGGGEPSTEDLRQAIQRYRTLFQRLLSA